MIMCSTWAAAVDGFAAVLQGLYRKAALSVLTSRQRWSDGRARQARNLPISILWRALPIKFRVEAAPYWPDPAASVREMFRVLRSGGSAWILINYYVENPHSHQWGSIINLPTRLLSIEDWKGLYRGAGFVNVEHRQIPDPTPVPENYSGRWFRDAEQMKNFHQVGALLVYGTKPGPSRPVSPRLLRNLTGWWTTNSL